MLLSDLFIFSNVCQFSKIYNINALYQFLQNALMRDRLKCFIEVGQVFNYFFRRNATTIGQYFQVECRSDCTACVCQIIVTFVHCFKIFCPCAPCPGVRAFLLLGYPPTAACVCQKLIHLFFCVAFRVCWAFQKPSVEFFTVEIEFLPSLAMWNFPGGCQFVERGF